MKRFFSVLLAVFVLVIGLTGSKTVFAASPFTPGKLAGTYNLISAPVVKEKGATLKYRPFMTVSEGGKGTVVITTSSEQKWQGIIDPKTGKGSCKMPITNKSGKVVGTADVEVRFKHLGGGDYSLVVMGGATYQKKGTGAAGPTGPSATQKEKTQKTDKNKQNNTAKQNDTDKQNTNDKADGKQTADKDLSDIDEEEHDDLPESDAGKVGVAVGTALGGGLLGLAGSAVGGATGGGAGGAAGSTGGGYGGYGGSDNGSGKNDYEDEYGEEYEDEPDEDYNDESDEDYEDEPDEDYEGEPGEENEDESGEDYEDEPGEENEDESGEDYEDESGEDYEDEPGEENEDESGEDYEDESSEENEDEYGEDYEDESGEENEDESGEENEDDRDDYNDDDRDDREEEREDYEDAVADDSSESEQDDATEAEDKPEPSDDVQNEPVADDVPSKENLDNVSVDDDGSLRVTTPTGEEIVYTRNEDGTYNMPTQTETGENLVDENGNAMEPGMVTTQEEILKGAQWYKDNEQAMLAERAEEDARQQAERDRLAAENAKWLEKEREKNSQLSQTSIDLMNEERQRKIDYEHEVLLDKIGLKHGTVEDYVTKNKENIMKALKRDTIKEYIKGGEYEGEAAKWDDRIVTAQETKFVVDQTVNAYGMLTHDPVLPKAYNAASNYTETMTDAYVNGKDMKKAFVKATADTTIDLVVDKGENYGFTAAVLSNTLGSGVKQMNDNLYNGREITDGVYDSMKGGAVTGLVSGGAGKLIQVSKGTVLDTKIADIGPNTRLDFWNNPKVGNVDANIPTGKVHTDVETDGMRPTSVAERRMGEGSLKPNTPDMQTSKPNVSDMQTSKTNLGDSNTGSSSKTNLGDSNTGSTSKTNLGDGNTGSTNKTNLGDGNTGSTNKTNLGDGNTGSTNKTNLGDGNTGSTSRKPVDDGNSGSANRKPVDDGNSGSTSRKPVDDGNSGSTSRKPVDDGNTGSSSKTNLGDGNSGGTSRKPVDDGNSGGTSRKPVDDGNSGGTSRKPVDDGNSGSTNRKPVDDGNTGSANRKPVDDGNSGSANRKPVDDGNSGSTNRKPVDDGNSGSTNRKPVDDGNSGSTSRKPVDDGNSGSANRKPVDDGNSGSTSRKHVDDGNSGSANRKPVDDGNTGSPTKPKPGDGNIDSTKPNTSGTESKNQSPASDAETRAQINEDLQGGRAMNEVRKLYKISEKMASMEKANPKGYQNDPEYQKLSEQFDSQAREVRENKLAIDRMNLLQGKTGTDLRTRYNKSDIEYEKKVLQYRNESLAQEYGLRPDQIGDLNVTSNKIEEKLAGGKAGHDTDTSPHVKVLSAGENDRIKTVDFTQVDGDHHLARAIYKAEHGRYPQTAAEYDEALRLKQLRDFTNVSTRPSDTHESYRNPDAYVGSGKGDVNKVLHPEKYGTPEKGTGVFNEQTAIHKQGTPLERHQQQYVEAQKLREQLKTDTNLSAAEKTAMGKRIADLEYQSASNHYESVRTTAKEFNVINKINDVNIKNGLGDGLSSDAKQIGKWANQVAKGEMDAGTYKKLVTEKYGSEENALKIVAKGFRDTNL